MKLMGFGFLRASELYERRRRMLRCTTRCGNLDRMLGGGVKTQVMTEFIGDYGVGKTRICMTLSVTAQLPKEGRRT